MTDWLGNRSSASWTFTVSGWLFLRLLGTIYLAAFLSLARQIRGLIGRDGLLPMIEFLNSHWHWGVRRFDRIPTLCWLKPTDGFLLFLVWAGVALAVLLCAGIAPLTMLALLWLLYLSLVTVGQVFFDYQWDSLLLEAGFLAIFLAPTGLRPQMSFTHAPSALTLGLLWWLLARLMLSSGLAKCLSGDPTWRKLTALCQHFETQPLPTRFAWRVHHFPAQLHKALVLVLFAIELGVPFLILGPPVARHTAALLFIGTMILFQLTGNYGFFNLLGIALSVLLLDDLWWQVVFQKISAQLLALALVPPASPARTVICAMLALVILTLSMRTMVRLFQLGINWPAPLERLFEWLEPFRLVNSYGLFAVMSTHRPEIIVEGSQDGVEWLPYEFKWKPGDVNHAPLFVAPHQPRLDWQMWFAALGFPENDRWFDRFRVRLLKGSPDVLSLLKKNPFPQAPPRWVRASLYDYRFTSRAERRATGDWWRRELRSQYGPKCALAGVRS